MTQYQTLPDGLPVPNDDGACDHLPGQLLPDVTLAATSGEMINLAGIKSLTVFCFYPMTGRPGVDLPDGWDGIPGARGFTPQSCAFRDHCQELDALGARVYGISVQNTNYQSEAWQHLHLPFALLSDPDLALKARLGLPTFQVDAVELYKRLTLIVDKSGIC